MIDLTRLPHDITKQIILFRNFLKKSWPFLDELMDDHDWESDADFIGDWLQVNWEFFLERELLQGEGFLTTFSITYLSTRVTQPKKVANYTVIAKSEKKLIDLKNQNILPSDENLRLYSFSTFKNGGFGLYPPFDLANLVIDSKKQLFTVPMEGLKFYLAAL